MPSIAHRCRLVLGAARFIALLLLAGLAGCATIPQGALVLAGAAYVALGIDLAGTERGTESPGFAAAVLAGEQCACQVARGDLDDSDCVRAGGWNAGSGAYRFTYTYDISDAEARRAEFAVVVTPEGEARLDVPFYEDQYLTCRDGALKGPSIEVGPRAAARTAVKAEPIVDRWTLSVRLLADQEHGFPVWRVERYLGGEPAIIVFCEVDALTGDVLRQGRTKVVVTYNTRLRRDTLPAEGF